MRVKGGGDRERDIYNGEPTEEPGDKRGSRVAKRSVSGADNRGRATRAGPLTGGRVPRSGVGRRGRSFMGGSLNGGQVPKGRVLPGVHPMVVHRRRRGIPGCSTCLGPAVPRVRPVPQSPRLAAEPRSRCRGSCFAASLPGSSPGRLCPPDAHPRTV